MKACVAYAHITIPTLESVERQCRYFLLTAEVAMLNGLIGESDSLMRAILSTINDNFDQKKIIETADILNNVLGFLVIMPSNPETSFFILVEGILNILKDCEWGS